MTKAKSRKEALALLGESVMALGQLTMRFYEVRPDHDAFCECLRDSLPSVIQSLEVIAGSTFDSTILQKSSKNGLPMH